MTDGRIVRWCSLGTGVDEPGAIFQEENALIIASPSRRMYQGVDLFLDVEQDAALELELATADQPPQHWAVPIKKVFQDPFQAALDDQGNRIFVERPPGDILAVEFDRPHLIFDLKELWKFRVSLRGSPFNAGTRVVLEVRLDKARGEQPSRWNLFDPLNFSRSGGTNWPTARYELTAGPGAGIPVELEMPDTEGVYDVVLTAFAHSGFKIGDAVTRPLGWGGPLIQRRVQVVVLNRGGGNLAPGTSQEMKLVGEAVDAGNPTFWDRLSKMSPPLPRLQFLSREGLLGRGWRRLRDGQQSTYNELAPSRPGEEPSWAIYSLPVAEPGLPHVLEVEWPADKKQSLLVAVVEPNAVGAVVPPLFDIGVTGSGELHQWGESLGWQVHRAVFWPKTQEPLLLLANPGNEPAVYGRIRVYAGWSHLPEYFPPAAFPTERILAAYFHKPLVGAQFGATDAPGPFRGKGIDDWVSFYQAITRLSEYLRYAGYNAAIITVAADGSTLFPSSEWQPTPRYDNGCFHPEGADPIRKDVVELLLRVADRDGFLVIPAMDFSTPLPSLEATIHRRGENGRSLRWVGSDGRTLNETIAPYRGMVPYYNILHREVQEGILNVIHEFADRYGRHPAFAGLGLQVSGYGYMHLPGLEWGMDDETVARFCEETGITLEVSGENRFQERARLLLGEYSREWARWRSQRLQSFFTRVNQELTAVRPDARLYLLAPTLFAGERWENRLRPSLLQRPDPLAIFQEVGLNETGLAADPGIALLRVWRVVKDGPLGLQAVEYEINQLFRDWEAAHPLGSSGVLLYQAPREIRLPSFDAQSPYSPTLTTIVHQPIPWGYESLRRYAGAFADGDPTFIADGSWRLPMGDEEVLRVWRATYRRLPAIPFTDVRPTLSSKSTQLLVLRSAVRGNETFVYMVNQAAFPVRASLKFRAPANTRALELSGWRSIPALQKDAADTWRWELDLGPYDFSAVKFTSPQILFDQVEVTYSSEISSRLKDQITELSERAATLSTPPLYEALNNAGFEEPPSTPGEIPHWRVQAGSDGVARLDEQEKKQGARALYLASRGSTVTVISEPFEAPPTGRLTVGIWLKTRNPTSQPPLRVFVLGDQAQFPFARYAEIGVSTTGLGVPMIGADWTPVLVQIVDLPLGRKGPVFLRIDLAGPGEVWLDDIQLCSLAFSKAERVELFKLIAPAQAKLENGEIADCLRLLNGYWPRYLMEYVPRADVMAQVPQENKETAPSNTRSVQNSGSAPDRSATLLDRLGSALPSKWRL